MEPSTEPPDLLLTTEEGGLWAARLDEREVRALPIQSSGRPLTLIRATGARKLWLLASDPVQLIEIDPERTGVVSSRAVEPLVAQVSDDEIDFGPYRGGVAFGAPDADHFLLAEATRPSERVAETDIGLVVVDAGTGTGTFFTDFLLGGDGIAPDPSAAGERALVAGVRPRRSREQGYLFQLDLASGTVVDSLQLTHIPGATAGGLLEVRAGDRVGTVVVETIREVIVLRLSPIRVVDRIPGEGISAWTITRDGGVAYAAGGEIVLRSRDGTQTRTVRLPADLAGEPIRSLAVPADGETVFFTTGPTRGRVAVDATDRVGSALHRLSTGRGGEVETFPVPGFRPEIVFLRGLGPP